MSNKDKKEREDLIKKLDRTLKQVDESQLATPPSLGLTALSGIMTFVAAAFVAWLFSGAPNTNPTTPSGLKTAVLLHQPSLEPQQIPTITLPRPSVSFFSKKVNLATPAIYRGTVVDQWRARSTWTFESLLSKAEIVNHNLVSRWSSCELRTEESRTFENLPELDDALAAVNIPHRENLDWKRMIELGKNDSSVECASVRPNWPQDLAHELHPLTQLYVPSPAATNTLIRIDTRNIIDPLSYYRGYRFYVQLNGEAKAVLIPSSDLDKAYLFPSISQFAGQSQVSLWPATPQEDSAQHLASDRQSKSFPNFQKAQIFEARLKPGDLLAIPPYWLSSFIALRPSASIMFSSETEAQQSASSVIDMPFGDILDKIVAKSTQPISRITASYLLALKLDFLRGDFEITFQTFVKNLLQERYESLLGQTDPELVSCDLDAGANLPDGLNAEIDSTLSTHTEFFFSLDYPVQLLLVKDAIERVAAYADAQNVVRTLRCWSSLTVLLV